MQSGKSRRGGPRSCDALRGFIRTRLPLADLGAWIRAGRGFDLPDAPDGHAVLELAGDRLRLEAVSAGLPRSR